MSKLFKRKIISILQGMNPAGISKTAPSRIKSVDQYWMVEYIEQELERLGWSINKNIYVELIKELGPYLYSRTANLSGIIRKTVFSAAIDKVLLWGIKPDGLKVCEKRLLRAFYKKDFFGWEIASRYWN